MPVTICGQIWDTRHPLEIEISLPATLAYPGGPWEMRANPVVLLHHRMEFA
jgi:hypothetical protein